jgi:hypothetical protein
MKLNKNAESIVGIMIAVSILAFAMLWIISILSYNRDISINYKEQVDSVVLKANLDNIVKKLDLSSINSNEMFYIHKDKSLKEYIPLTWSINENYKFIDKLWNNIDLDNFRWNIYTRELTKISNVWIWQNWENNVEYDTIETIIKKYNKN